jgi:hypothetical protein
MQALHRAASSRSGAFHSGKVVISDMKPSTKLASLSLLALVCFACGDDKSALDTLNASSGGETAVGGSEASTGTGDPTTGEPEPQPFVPSPVRGGLEIDWVEANQGVGVAIGRDGAGVGGADRTSYLIQNRLTLIRAFWKDLPPDWVPRRIEGRLTVTYPDGTELVQSSTPMIDINSFIGSLSRSFYWGLMKEQVVPGLKYRIELFETEPGHEDLPEGVNPPRLPYTGDTLVGIETSDQVMKVTIVPFNYDSGDGCKTSPDTSEATMKLFNDKMYMMNPLDTLEITMHPAIDWATKLSDFDQLNSYLSKLRADEGAEPERYYFGLVDVCSGGLGGAGGKAFGIPQGGKVGDAWLRVSSGLSIAKDTEFSSDTFVHEVGHTQGRYHVLCSGGEGGPDNSYPWPKGQIHDWGFGVLDYALHHPTVNADYMTYCHPVWASSWGWNKVYPVIKNLSSWDDAGAPAPDGGAVGALMVGSLYPDGHSTWFTTPGSLEPEQLSAIHGVEFEIAGQRVQQAAAYLPQPDGDVVLLATPLPDRWDEVSAITRLAGDERFTIERAAVDEHHRRGLKAPH